MIKMRGRSLRLLGLAILAIALIPCFLEFGLRIAACRSSLSSGADSNSPEVIASWTTHHQLAPLQQKHLTESRGPKPADTPADEASGDSVLFRTNSLGLRGREPAVPKPANVFRILLLGDESILGSTTAESQTVAARLEHWLQTRSRGRIEVINAGQPDSCPLLSYLRVRHGLLLLNPDLLLIDVNLSDIADDHVYRRYTELAASGQPLVATHPALSAPKRCQPLSENFLVVRHAEQLVASLLSRPSLRTSGDSLVAIPATRETETQQEQIAMLLSPLEDLARLVAPQGRLVIATHPTQSEFERKARQDSSSLSAKLRDFTRERGLVLCESMMAFRKASEKGSLFKSSNELSGRGHETYARSLAVALVDQIEGPWLPAHALRQADAARYSPRSSVSGRQRTPLSDADSPGESRPQARTESGFASENRLENTADQFRFHNPNPPGSRPETRLAPVLEQR